MPCYLSILYWHDWPEITGLRATSLNSLIDLTSNSEVGALTHRWPTSTTWFQRQSKACFVVKLIPHLALSSHLIIKKPGIYLLIYRFIWLFFCLFVSLLFSFCFLFVSFLCVCLFVYLFVFRLFVCSFVRLLVCSFVRLLVCSFVRLLIC